jgi:hypothetical protein
LDSLFYRFVNLRVPELSPETGTQQQIKDEDHKCGLEIVNTIAFNLDMFDNDKQLLKLLLQRPITETSFANYGNKLCNTRWIFQSAL